MAPPQASWLSNVGPKVWARKQYAHGTSFLQAEIRRSFVHGPVKDMFKPLPGATGSTTQIWHNEALLKYLRGFVAGVCTGNPLYVGNLKMGAQLSTARGK